MLTENPGIGLDFFIRNIKNMTSISLKKTGSRKNPTPRFLPKSNQTLKLYKLVKRGLFFFLFDINKKSIYIKDPILIVTNIQVFDLDKPGVITYFLRNNTQIELGIYRQSDSEFLF